MNSPHKNHNKGTPPSMKKAGHRARKRFGQNFLQDDTVIQNIASAISPQGHDNLIEIGPGLGALTQSLLEANNNTLTAIELDRDLVPVLRTKFFNCENFVIHEADALSFDYSTLYQQDRPLRLVGNLPYNISTPLIFHLLSHAPIVHDMHFMLQKEVVDRLIAQPKTSHYGRLSVMVQRLCDAQLLLDVPPEAFHPVPKVNSAVVRLTPRQHEKYPVLSTSNFELVVRTAFSQRRKTLRNTLKPLIASEQLETLGINPQVRSEQLAIEDFIKISNFLHETATHSNTDS